MSAAPDLRSCYIFRSNNELPWQYIKKSNAQYFKNKCFDATPNFEQSHKTAQ